MHTAGSLLGDPGRGSVFAAQRACVWEAVLTHCPVSPCKWARQLGITLGSLGTATDQLPGFNQVTSCFLLGAGFLQVGTEPGLPPVHLAFSLSEVSWGGG